MSRFTRALAVLPLAAVLALASCAGETTPRTDAPAASSSESAAAEATTRVVTTDQGEVTIPADPQRVVLLNFALAGYLFDLDVPVVGLTQEDFDYEASFSDFWADDAEAQGTEFISWSGDGFDLEAILALEPDLIVGGGVGFPLMLATQAYDDLGDIAPTVIVSGTKATWQEQFSFLAGDVFGKGEVYDEALAAYEKRVDEVAAAITPPPAPSAFLSILPDGRVFVAREDMGLPVVFASVGIEAAPLWATGDYEPYTPGGDSFELSTEQVGQVVTQPSVFITGFNTDIGDIDALSQNPVLAALPSFQSGDAHVLPYWVARGDYDEALALLDIIEELFG
ncbi:ABC transporter substrate-binding protein [Microbacterium sp. No. 7]|uniref:ABC transporter substrate-binding protein n=1 Tax=Microbacterium sp. No. 7 TaxID=1714373 RepID=UPI0006D27D0B|nr:ABC transporter substrate-binding protein [Microbacterium sp. No. 7]ALJ19778.1 ferric enterobactin (enterochelin)-binding protein [Microbacterium sp. No. 7]